MPNEKFRYNAGWIGKSLTCDSCGETRGVKYIVEGKHWCNKCVYNKFIVPQEPEILPKTFWDEYHALGEALLGLMGILVGRPTRTVSRLLKG